MKTKTQSIKKSDLQRIYKHVCNEWKVVIADLLFDQNGPTIEVENELVSKAYQQADTSQKKMLESYFDVKPSNVTSRIKTWEDVVKELDLDEDEVLPYPEPKTNKIQLKSKAHRSANAFAKIQLISRALNEGWVPDFTNTSQNKYYPYFERKAHGWVLRSYSFDFDIDCCYLGFGCLYKTSDLAIYAGTQFLDIYKDYLPE